MNLFWTSEAIRNLEDILDYLTDKWTKKEIEKFKKLLGRQINVIQQYPTIFATSETCPKLRKAVLSSQTILFYELKDQNIYIIYLFNANQNPEKIK